MAEAPVSFILGGDLTAHRRLVLEYGVPQENLASAVNASRIQVARICSRLQKEGVIRTRRGRVFILDEAALGEAQPYP